MKRNIRFSVVFAVMLVCLAMVGAANVNAATEESQFEWKCDYYNNTAELSKYVGSETVVQVPREVDGCKVIAIGDSAFSYSEVVKVELPDTIKEVGYMAFTSCEFLRQISLPNSVTEIQSYAFKECVNLESMKLPEALKALGTNAFNGCTSLKDIIIPKNLKNISAGAFESCENLKKVSISSNLTSIDSDAFAYCKKLESINLPASLKSIERGVFNGCESLSKINIPVGLKEIGWDAFKNCASLKNVLIPDTVEDLGWDVFRGCTSLKKAIIYGSPDIGDDLFTPSSTLTVYGYAGSSVQAAAKENGVRFVALNKPTSLKGSVVSKKYGKLSWKSAKGAAGYQIYRSTKKSSRYAKIAETKGTTYTDKKVKRGSTYYYKVRVYMYDVDKVKIYGNYTGAVAIKVPR